ncbi:hypothetical protein AB4876_05555 [Zhongshania guokunii]|uniref:Uncharacterized protein n=1 Tax=Zhongshania guokunii TaxID=641783 RepID=A0ABV3U515_9GAMM
MINLDTVIRTVSAPCSSGKTYSTCKYLAEQEKRSNWLYVAPSKKLLSQTKTQLVEHGLKPVLITSDTHKNNVVGAIMRHMACSEESGSILLITWQSYQILPFFENNQNWRVIIDEVPQVDNFYALNLRQHMDELTKFVQIGEVVNETLATVIPIDSGELKRHLERSDDLTKTIHPFLSDVLSPNRDVFVDLKTWGDFAERGDFGKKDATTRIYFISMLNPLLFEGHTLLGANIEDSLLYSWLRNYHSAEFKTNHQINKNLRFTAHPPQVGERLRINYLLRDRGFSKYLAGKPLKDDGRTWMEALDKAALIAIKGRPFLFSVNADYSGELFNAPNGTQIPVVSHGLNSYMDHNILYFPVALNRAPRHLHMLNELGMDGEMVKNSTIHEVIYQALMRTALRNPESDVVVECIVPEFTSALRLCRAFGTMSAKWIGDEEFVKKIAMTSSQRTRKANAGKRHNRHNRLNLNLPHSDNFSLITKEREEHMAEQGSGYAPLYAVTFHKDIYEKIGDDFYLDYFEPNEFVREMRSYSKQVIEEKTATYMINSTVFEKRNNADEGLRCQANYLESSMMILDFDNGDLSIDDFIDIFWNKAGRGNKRSFLIANSFSRSSEQPNRFRVFMLYKQPATSLDAHKAVFDSIVNRLEHSGYDSISSGLDRACRTGNQSFYMPCTNAENRDWHYFNAFGCTTRGVDRHGVDPYVYLRTAIKPSSEITKVVGIHDKAKDEVKKPIVEWKEEINGMSWGRRKVVYSFALALVTHHKLSQCEVERHLYALANGDPNLDSHIEGALSSLKNKGYLASPAAA